MPAHFPRRNFAKPFIVTVAAAAASAACHETTHDATPTNPPPVEQQPPALDTRDASASTNSAPVEPATSEREWTITRSAKTLTCVSMANDECKSKLGCNPPPPGAYACPANLTNYPAEVFQHKGETTCVTQTMLCPPGSFCNPPPTQIVVVPCPK